MQPRRHTHEQVICKLREANKLLAERPDIATVARNLEVSEQTYHLLRNQYGGMNADDAKQLKELERETGGSTASWPARGGQRETSGPGTPPPGGAENAGALLQCPAPGPGLLWVDRGWPKAARGRTQGRQVGDTHFDGDELSAQRGCQGAEDLSNLGYSIRVAARIAAGSRAHVTPRHAGRSERQRDPSTLAHGPRRPMCTDAPAAPTEWATPSPRAPFSSASWVAPSALVPRPPLAVAGRFCHRGVSWLPLPINRG